MHSFWLRHLSLNFWMRIQEHARSLHFECIYPDLPSVCACPGATQMSSFPGAKVKLTADQLLPPHTVVTSLWPWPQKNLRRSLLSLWLSFHPHWFSLLPASLSHLSYQLQHCSWGYCIPEVIIRVTACVNEMCSPQRRLGKFSIPALLT